jgi:hypothetical protein
MAPAYLASETSHQSNAPQFSMDGALGCQILQACNEWPFICCWEAQQAMWQVAFATAERLDAPQ